MWGVSAALAEGRLHGPDCAVEVYQLEESEEEVTVLVGVESPKKQDAAGRAAPGVRSSKSSEYRKGE